MFNTPAAMATIAVAALGSLVAVACTPDPAEGIVDESAAGIVDESAPVPAEGEMAYPTLESAGLPADWTPTRTIDGDHVVDERGAVVEDVRVVGDLIVQADDVTVRRVEIIGGSIRNVQGTTCRNGLRIEDVTVRRGSVLTSGHSPAIGIGGYTARNVAIDGMPEGFRVGGRDAGCGPVVIEDSIAHIVAPEDCVDWHGDGLQGYIAPQLTLRNTVLVLDGREGCEGTAPFFYPSGQNTSVDIERLVVDGGGYPFRLGTAGRVEQLNVVDESWLYLPYLVECEKVESWSAAIVELDDDGQPVARAAVDCVERPPGSFP